MLAMAALARQVVERRIEMPLPTLTEVQAMLAPRFRILECSFGGYEMGDRCARLVMRRR